MTKSFWKNTPAKPRDQKTIADRIRSRQAGRNEMRDPIHPDQAAYDPRPQGWNYRAQQADNQAGVKRTSFGRVIKSFKDILAKKD